MGQDPMRRRLVIVCLAFLLLVLVGVLAVHTPPVRSYALRFAIRAAMSRGVQIDANRLDYNLATRRVRLANVKVSAAGDAQPFFTADNVVAAASHRVFFGEIAIDEVTVTNGAVHIVRRADGTTNLPKSSGGGTGDPAPLPIARINAPRLAVEYRDESANITLSAPALTVDLSSRGRLALDAPPDLSCRLDEHAHRHARERHLVRRTRSAVDEPGVQRTGTSRSDRRHARAHQATSVDRRSSGQRQ